MYFWDKKKYKETNNCPSCLTIFIQEKGVDCSPSCKERKLEELHKEVVVEIVRYCLPKTKIFINFPKNLPTESFSSYGWTSDKELTITIPWYTLRNKEEFFDTVIHELAHITAFMEKFSPSESEILVTYGKLWDEYELSKDSLLKKENKEKFDDHFEKNQKIIDSYDNWEGHEYEPWYLEYLKIHEKLVNSPFVKYAYGKIKPYPYGHMTYKP